MADNTIRASKFESAIEQANRDGLLSARKYRRLKALSNLPRLRDRVLDHAEDEMGGLIDWENLDIAKLTALVELIIKLITMFMG